MGGFNSGNHGGKSCTIDMRALDVRKVQREGLLRPGHSFGWSWKRGGETVASINIKVHTGSVTLDYRNRPHGGEWQAMNYPVRLAWTPCHYGGQRAWWLCPAVGCGRRVAVLYGGSVFACRHCQRLAYQCQKETQEDRNIRRAETLRERLGWAAGILNHAGGKPKGMHWQTFWRLQARHDQHAQRALAAMWVALGKSVKTLDHINLVTADL